MAGVVRSGCAIGAHLVMLFAYAAATLSACDRGSLTDDEKPQFCADKPDGDSCGTRRVCRAGSCVPVPPDRDASSDAEEQDYDAAPNPPDSAVDAAFDAATPADASEVDADRPDAAFARCGDGVIQPDAGEVCDGLTVTAQGQRLACAADCRAQLPEDECSKCQARECTKFYDVDLVAGCFTKIDPQFAADPADLTFLSECSEAFNCALAAGCAFEDAAKGPMQCYCGSASLDDCPAAPASDAACGAQWRRAARAKDPATTFGNMSDLAFPITWAYKLLDCLRDLCSDVCQPVR